jgi:DNA-binding CsgD family transcriptional regulator
LKREGEKMALLAQRNTAEEKESFRRWLEKPEHMPADWEATARAHAAIFLKRLTRETIDGMVQMFAAINRRADSTLREAALSRLSEWYLRTGPPRSLRLGTALRTEARKHGRTDPDELHLRLLAALVDAIELAREKASETDPGGAGGFTYEDVRLLVSRGLKVDLLGPGWRDASEGKADDLDRDLSHEPEVEIALEMRDVLALIATRELSQRENEMIEGLLLHDETPTETADRLGIAPSTARVLRGRARTKLRSM